MLSNGKILEYKIEVVEDGEQIIQTVLNATEELYEVFEFTVKRHSVAYVEVTARNSVGYSPTAELAVPLAQGT